MATGWNGSGTFTRGDGTREGATTWAQAKAASQKIDAPPHDTHDEILAQGIQACIAKNGENAMTGNLNMGGFSLSNWTQASDVVMGTGINFTMQGVFTTTSITASGVINSDTGMTTEYLTAVDTVTTAELSITNSLTFLSGNAVPAGIMSTGDQGEIRWDSNHIYLAIGPDTWKRVALSNW